MERDLLRASPRLRYSSGMVEPRNPTIEFWAAVVGTLLAVYVGTYVLLVVPRLIPTYPGLGPPVR